MNYRARLLLTILAAVVLTNALTFGVACYFARRALFEEIGNNALSVSATAAAFVDGEQARAVQKAQDEKTEAYRGVHEVLKKARDANRREDTQVSNLYTMKAPSWGKEGITYGVDAEENPEKRSHPDEMIRIEQGRVPVVGQQGVDRDGFSKDEQGWWLTANTPFKDGTGNVAGAVGVDFEAGFVSGKLNRMTLAGLAGFGLAVALGAVFAGAYSARASRPLRALWQTVDAVGQGDLGARAEAGRRDEFGLIAERVNAMTDGLRQKEAVKSALVSFVSAQVLERVLETCLPPTVQTERRKVTVLFSDIREFTRMSEHMRPEEVVAILNEYFEMMVSVVVRNHGTVNKFIGDGLMAFFGVPDDDGFQEEHAVCAALEMQRELRQLCRRWNAEGRRSLQIGIGINSGNAIIGNIGSAQRLEYTAIGDTVNLASRLESATKDFDADVLISEYTFNGLKGAPFKMTRRGTASVKGRTDGVTVYAVEPATSAEAEPQVGAAS